MKFAPVVIFTFNRLEHTKKMIEALKKNILAKDTEVFIFCDGPRNSKEALKVEKVRKYIKSIEGFKKINIIESEKNKGLAKAVIDGVTNIINEYNKVIVLEDDLITSSYFLTYMNKGLDLYENRKDIWSLSGYGPNINIPIDYKEEIYITKRGSSWGWATWKDRWELVDWNVEDYNRFKRNKNERKRFDECGKDLSLMLDDQMKGRIDSWAIRWVYSQFKKNMWTIYPTKSLVKNIGNDLSGTHTTTTTHFDVSLNEKNINLKYNIKANNDIVRNFKLFYDKNFSGYLAIFIKKIGLYKIMKKIRKKILIKL